MRKEWEEIERERKWTEKMRMENNGARMWGELKKMRGERKDNLRRIRREWEESGLGE